MTLVKFRKRPWKNLFTSDLLDFDVGNLLNDKLWQKNGRTAFKLQRKKEETKKQKPKMIEIS